ISWAWELLTEVYKLDRSRLYATVFEGDETDGVAMDNEAREYWLQYLPADHIILGDKHDNFWEMGETGPCGPCSEIHIDLRDEKEIAKLPGRELVNKSDPLVIEIWNLVFMQFQRMADGHLEPLPKTHVDTGMGLERLVMAINGNKSNYDGDMFQSLIHRLEEISGLKYGEDRKVSVAMRVIADHIRAISFSIADGQLPSNVKAGYVIRRILRRAVRYGYTFLNFDTPSMCRLVATLVENMGQAYPELIKQQSLIEKVIKEEEEAFLRTIEKGGRLINAIMEKNRDTQVISGHDAFVLYDTYGFPLDLSELIARENGFTIDEKAFDEELRQQKERARNAAAKEEGDWMVISPCESTDFIGYDETEADVHIVRYRTVRTKGKELFELVFDRTPFYAEMGGQVGDSGILTSPSGETVGILNTIKENGLPIHIAEKIPENPSGLFHAAIDTQKRQDTANNHTATHLLHYALRSIIGTHIEQKGSFVSPDYFRFDFSHFEKISPDKLKEVERMVNRLIRQDLPKEEFRDLPIEEARAKGAMALFGEKYGNRVRCIKFGNSIELCGGTHVASTGNIGMFHIISESAVAAGIRRIEATTGRNVEKIFDALEEQIANARMLLGNTPDLMTGIRKVLGENAQSKALLEEAEKERQATLKKKLMEEKTETEGITLFRLRGTYRSETVRNVAFELHNELTSSALAAAITTPDGKPFLVLMYTDDLVQKGFNAGKEVKEAGKLIQGGGGGQPFLATAGGKNPNGLDAAFGQLLSSLRI
ncbi:MAG: alanine--tRNA ligase, partial [Alistipes sp.]|nr:alanine--tRNA ligase [Candidatus Minthomonas equi]